MAYSRVRGFIPALRSCCYVSQSLCVHSERSIKSWPKVKSHTASQISAVNFDLVGLGKNMGNLILAIKNVFSLNKKFDSGLFF